MGCTNCGKTKCEILKTAYGDFICEDCWDEYINSDEGKLEYFIGICRGDLSIDEFDADFLCEAAKSWMLYYLNLDLSAEEVIALTLKAEELGIL